MSNGAALERLHAVAAYLQPHPAEPIRSVVTETDDLTVVAWVVLPGQAIGNHVHPLGSDVWTVLQGQGLYHHDPLDRSTPPLRLRQGDVAVARAGQVHGVLNDGHEPLVFVSVVAPLTAGYAAI